MAPLPLDTPDQPSPERTTPPINTSLPDDDVSVISRPAVEALPLAWRKALGQELRQVWTSQIAPHITCTVQDNLQNIRQQLTEVQRQVTQVRQSLSEDSARQHNRTSYPDFTSLAPPSLSTTRQMPAARFHNPETVSSNTPTHLDFDIMEHEQQQRTIPPYT